MSTKKGPAHVVVDGSNIATEGRSMPSLAQLSEAVASFMEEYPDTSITVVVDATFGHRIDKRELAEFEAGISNNELVAPPAGAVGRGDAFVLGIADKANASVLSNDSFQEFHGDYTWLFDEGRLIGGKPVPHVGWVWVDRVPVRGPVSRKATRGSGSGSRRSSGGRSRRGSSGDEASVRTASKEASEPMPTPKSPPPGRARDATESKTSRSKRAAERSEASTPARSPGAGKGAPKGGEPVNELMPFLDFVEHHPVGTSVNGTVDAYSSHGAYITIGDTDVRGYVPLRLMAAPTPRSAKSVMKIGESVTVVVVSFAPARRSIDCALPDMADAAIAEATTDDTAVAAAAAAGSAKRAATKKRAGKPVAAKKKSATETSVTTTSAGKKTAAKKTAAKKTAAKKSAAKKSPAKTSATKTTAADKAGSRKKPAAKQSAARKTATRKSAAKKTATEKSAAKKSAAKKRTATKKTTAKRPPAKKAATKKSGSKKPAPTKVAAEESSES